MVLLKIKLRFFLEASFKSSTSIRITAKNNTIKDISSKNICIASGGRPRNQRNFKSYYCGSIKKFFKLTRSQEASWLVGAIGVEFVSFLLRWALRFLY